MRIDTEYRLSDDPQEQKLQLEKSLRDIGSAVNGDIREFTPTIFATGTAGTITYTTQEGWYVRQGQMVDYWYDITWSAWAGAPTGSIRMSLPLKVWKSDSNFWVNPCMAEGVTFANIADTVAHMICFTDTYYADLTSSGNNRTLGVIAPQAAGTIRGHVRYLGQQDV
jgi:hypothetical protein